jgi:hypothetical protein
MSEERRQELKEEREEKQRKRTALESLLDRTRQNLTEEHREHLRSRGLIDEQINFIGYEPRQEPEDKEKAKLAGLVSEGYYLPANRYVIPVTVHSAVEYAVFYDPGKDTGKKYLFPSGLDQPLWGGDAIQDPSNPVYLTAGTFGYLSARAAGLPALFGFGIDLSPDQIEELKRRNPEELRIIFDVGKEEQEQAEQLARDLWPEVKANIVSLRGLNRDTPDGYDLNDMWCGVDFDADRFREELEGLDGDTILEREFNRFENAADKAAKMDDLAPLLADLDGIRRDEYVEEIYTLTPWGKGNIREKIRDVRSVPVDPGDGEPEEIQFEDEAVPEGLTEPGGWSVTGDGVFRLKETQEGIKRDRVAADPVLISHRYVTTDSDPEVFLNLLWRYGGRWREKTVSRKVLMDSRRLVDLAESGVPVGSGNVRELAEYLQDFEAENMNRIPADEITTSLGWSADGDVFVLGDSVLPESENGVSFHAIDPGHQEIADGFRKEGGFENWREAIEPLEDYPKARLVLYASFTAPLLEIFDAENPIVEVCGRTSRGKTTIQRVAASVWGDPRLTSPSSVLGTWKATQTYIERAATLLNGLPLILDDTSTAGDNRDMVSDTFYAVYSGQGKGRGTVEGIQSTGTWRTALISSGEQSISEFSDQAGAVARSLTLRGSPFGRVTDETEEIVSDLNFTVRQNFGHAGPEFVKWLLDHTEEWEDFREEYRNMIEKFGERVKEIRNGDPVANRYAETFALLDVTAALVHSAIDMPFEYTNPIEEVMDDLLQGAEEADTGKQAMKVALDWIIRSKNRFKGADMTLPDDEEDHPHGGYWGVWGDLEEGNGIGMFRTEIEEELEEHGFVPKMVFKDWKERGWLKVHGDDRLTAKKRFDGKQIRMIVISPEADNELPW